MSNRVARLVLAAALLASAVLLFHYRQEIGFLADDLIFLRDRAIGGLGTLLDAHYEHIAVVPAAIYRLLYIVFGIASPVPFQAVSLLAFLASIVAFFAYVRRQVGEPVAALVAIPVLFMGTAYHDLLWTFQIGFSLSILLGLVGLIAIVSRTPHGDLVAVAALALAVLTSSLGLSFLPAAAILLIDRDGRRFWRNPALLVPAALFLLWYAGWGREADSFFSLANLVDTPSFVAESVKSVLMGLTGLHRLSSPLGDILGWILTAALTVGTAWHLYRERKVPVEFLVALAAGLTFWVLLSLNQAPGIESRSPDQSRFQYPGAIFLLMILCGAFAGVRPGRLFQAGLAALAAVSIFAGLAVFETGTSEMKVGADYPRAGMTAVDIAGDRAVPQYELNLVPYFDVGMSLDRYRQLTDRYGPAGWTDREIADLPEELKRRVDGELVGALGLAMEPVHGANTTLGECESRVLAGEATRVAELSSGEVLVRTARGRVTVSADRFSDETPAELGAVAKGSSGRLLLPADRSSVPWKVSLTGTGRVRVCVDPGATGD